MTPEADQDPGGGVEAEGLGQDDLVRPLELADFLLIAEAVLGMPAKKIAEDASLNLADSALHAPLAAFGGVEAYPDFATKAAVLCTHLVKNHPLKDGNGPVALIATIEFCQRNGHPWNPPAGDVEGEETAARILTLAAEPVSEAGIDALAVWIRARMNAPA